MKRVCIIFLLSIIISLTALGLSDPTQSSKVAASENYFRVHIRADSNEEGAQEVKYEIRDVLVDYLTPLVAEYGDKQAAIDGVSKRLNELESLITQTLYEKGFSYGARVQVRDERFPTRVYEGYTLPSGEYTALIVTLGKGEGDNWWCGVYPPLCFTAPTGKVV